MSLLDNVNNFYEQWALEVLNEQLEAMDQAFDEDYLVDVICVALNHLPPRYYRHKVDMVFYTSPEERLEMRKKVEKAVKNALTFVAKHQRADD